MAHSTKKGELDIITSGYKKNKRSNAGRNQKRARVTFNIPTMNVLTIIMYLVSLGIVALAMAVLPKIMGASERLSQSDLFYEGYYIALNILVVVIYFLWGHWMVRWIRGKASLGRVILSFSVITIGNLLLMLFLTILGLTAQGDAAGFEWMVFISLNFAFMPLMDLLSRLEFIPGITYFGYLVVAVIPVIFMTMGARWRK